MKEMNITHPIPNHMAVWFGQLYSQVKFTIVPDIYFNDVRGTPRARRHHAPGRSQSRVRVRPLLARHPGRGAVARPPSAGHRPPPCALVLLVSHRSL